ncbi:MAG: cytochrome b/b6 domain-containing protein [Rhodocyclaceae bacterium]|nr:cytochrome b/b6 domain-containing protein [Rhodocyclaceae bacterium]
MNQRILVWDLPTRVFHWSLAASFGVAYLTAESESLHLIHLICGYLFFALIGFRLLWGLAGSRHARFTSFVRGPAAVVGYLRSLMQGRPQHFTGHNPAGAIAVVLLLLLGTATAVSGWLTLNQVGGETFEELHEALATGMLALVVIHILGVVVSSRLHRENLAAAMVTGRKSGSETESIRNGHGIIAVLLAAALTLFAWGLAQGKLPALLDPAAIAAEIDDGAHRDKDDD